jgi:hypothetical protein
MIAGLDNHSSSWEHTVLDLSGFDYAGSAYIRFAGYSNWGINFCNLAVDSFEFSGIIQELEVPEVTILELEDIVGLRWRVVAGATHYRVEGSDDPATGFTALGTTNHTSFSEPYSQRRFYRVIAVME